MGGKGLAEGAEQSVLAVLDEVYAAWAAGDAEAFVSHYALDATAQLPGTYLRGRTAIQEEMAAAFAGPLKGSRAVYTPQAVRFVGEVGAIVLSRGAVVPPGLTKPDPGGWNLETWVMEKPNGRWQVAAFHACPDTAGSAEADSAASSRPSSESATVRDMYLAWVGKLVSGAPQDDEAWGDLTTEPRGVDYTELEAAGRPAIWAVPKDHAADRVLLCIHGGGFVGGSRYTHRKMFAHLAKATGARALIFDYRLAPVHTHPSQVEDATAVYRWLLEEVGIDPSHVALVGDSSGGGLTITTQLLARRQGLPLPAAVAPLSPWVDMEVLGASYESNWARDPYFRREMVLALVDLFLQPGGDRRDPLANPLYADLSGLAPMYIQVGGDETLLDDARRLADQGRAAGVEVRLDIFHHQLHTFQMAAGRAPEADDAIRRLASWLQPKLGLAGHVTT
jgi:epsilon-lactone hydrolase